MSLVIAIGIGDSSIGSVKSKPTGSAISEINVIFDTAPVNISDSRRKLFTVRIEPGVPTIPR